MISNVLFNQSFLEKIAGLDRDDRVLRSLARNYSIEIYIISVVMKT